MGLGECGRASGQRGGGTVQPAVGFARSPGDGDRIAGVLVRGERVVAGLYDLIAGLPNEFEFAGLIGDLVGRGLDLIRGDGAWIGLFDDEPGCLFGGTQRFLHVRPVRVAAGVGFVVRVEDGFGFVGQCGQCFESGRLRRLCGVVTATGDGFAVHRVRGCDDGTRCEGRRRDESRDACCALPTDVFAVRHA